MPEPKQQRATVIVTGPNRRFKPAWWATRFQLWRAGLRAVYLSPKLEPLPVNIDGVIIGGGSDVEPTQYGEKLKAGTVYDPERDLLELNIIRLALKTDLPLLGVCRGAQLINVIRGGTLHSDIRGLRRETPNENSVFAFKNAFITSTSKLARTLQETCIRINSLHNQAVKDIGDGLVAVAHDRDGFIQAIEDPKRHFLLGVQWHPEYLLLNKTQKTLFSAFAQATFERRARRYTH